MSALTINICRLEIICLLELLVPGIGKVSELVHIHYIMQDLFVFSKSAQKWSSKKLKKKHFYHFLGGKQTIK